MIRTLLLLFSDPHAGHRSLPWTIRTSGFTITLMTLEGLFTWLDLSFAA